MNEIGIIRLLSAFSISRWERGNPASLPAKCVRQDSRMGQEGRA